MFTNVLYIKEMSTNEKEDEQWNQEEIIGTRTTNHSTNNLKLSCSSVRVTFICEFICPFAELL